MSACPECKRVDCPEQRLLDRGAEVPTAATADCLRAQLAAANERNAVLAREREEIADLLTDMAQADCNCGDCYQCKARRYVGHDCHDGDCVDPHNHDCHSSMCKEQQPFVLRGAASKLAAERAARERAEAQRDEFDAAHSEALAKLDEAIDERDAAVARADEAEQAYTDARTAARNVAAALDGLRPLPLVIDGVAAGLIERVRTLPDRAAVIASVDRAFALDRARRGEGGSP